MKAQNAPVQVREFFKMLLDFHRHDLSQVFDDFLTLVTCCYAWQTKEDEYLKTIERYNKKEIDLFPQMLGNLILMYGNNVSDSTWFDPLGIIYETIASNYKKSNLGQFFTPDSLCTMMAQFNFEGPTEETKYVNDCCVGSGRMGLAASRANPNILFFGEDKDPICCKMAAINLMFHGVRAQIVNVDSLLLDDYRRGYLINWNIHESKIFSCLDLPAEKSYTWQMWQERAKVETAKTEIAAQQISFEF